MQRTAVIYGDIQNQVEKKALQNLSEILLQYTDSHPVYFTPDETLPEEDYIVFYIGTKENNSCIREKSTAVLSHDEEYAIHVDGKEVIIEGFDHAGVLYGVSDFLNKYVPSIMYNNGAQRFSPFDDGELPKYDYTSYPKINKRGFWTWGYVIYDYKGYIDAMVKMKLNSLVIWNDFAPLNANELVEYAHSCNVKVIWGMPWLWDVDCSTFDMNNLQPFSQLIFDTYEKQYANVKGDGVYFQTFTELQTEYIGEFLIAKAAAEFVNKTSALFLDKYPDMELQFGLHAESVREKTEFIATVDPRIRIVWENCGAFPHSHSADYLVGYDETIAFTEKIAQLRGEGERFGFVNKAMSKLRWDVFKHLTGPHFIGVASKTTRQDKIREKSFMRKFSQSYWCKHAEYAAKGYKAMKDVTNGDMYALGLVEDSMVEEKPFFSVALFAELIWNPDRDSREVTAEVLLRDYVECE